MSDSTPIFYATTWCGSCRRLRFILDQHGVPYHWVDIDQDEAAARALESLARGFRSVPTLLWPDGSLLIEPSLDELAKKMGITLP